MSRLISFVLADSFCEPREKSENYKMKNSCPQREPTTFCFLDWRSSRLCHRIVLIPCRHLKVNYTHINIDIRWTTTWRSNQIRSLIMHCNVRKLIQYLNLFAIDHCRFIFHRQHTAILDNIHSAPF